ncbi:MAG: hypothetical protein ABJC04_10670, partial [Verrucomicrobiota bacterium]
MWLDFLNVRKFFLSRWWIVLLGVSGCASPSLQPEAPVRSFVFGRDTLAFRNELKWEYQFDEDGRRSSRLRQPAPQYELRCFPMSHAVRQFFERAEFDPSQLVAEKKVYHDLVRKIVWGGEAALATNKIIVPGYGSLREFSIAQEEIMKAECGGVWRSYFQRGHWRMVLPFTHGNQKAWGKKLMREIQSGHPAVVHLARFPQLSINHAVVVFHFNED